MAAASVSPMKGEALTSKWNKFAAAYGDVMEQWSWPAYAALVSASGIPVLAGKAAEGVVPAPESESGWRERPAPGVVLDIGCGPGSHSVELARSFPSLRVLATDLAPDMIRRASEAPDVPANIRFAVFSADSDEVAAAGMLEAVRSELGDDAEAFAPSESPGAVAAVANLVMQIVPNTGAALAGVAASLRSGAPFCFSVWGDKSQSPLFTLLPQALAACESGALRPVQDEIRDTKASVRSGFHLGGDVTALRELVAKHGFESVSVWESRLPMPGGPVRSAADGAGRLMRLVPNNASIVEAVRKAGGEDGVSELRAQVESRVAELLERGAPLGLHVLLVSCRKAA